MIDDTDLRILQQLKENGRASFSDIADELGIATSTVTSRFQKMREKGILTGFRPVIDYEKLGFDLTAMIDIRAESEKTPEVAEKLQEKDRVISFFEVTGKTDMTLISRFRDREEMNEFVKSLQKTEGVKSTETHIILTPPKLEDNMNLEQLRENKL